MYITHRHAYQCAYTRTYQVSAREWMHAERFAWEKMGQPLGDNGNPVTLIDCLDAHTLHPRSVKCKQAPAGYCFYFGAITQRVASRNLMDLPICRCLSCRTRATCGSKSWATEGALALGPARAVMKARVLDPSGVGSTGGRRKASGSPLAWPRRWWRVGVGVGVEGCALSLS